MFVRAIAVALVMGAALAAPAPAEDLKIQKSWKGEIDEKAAGDVGEALVIVNQKEWEKFWKKVKPKEKTPAVDFAKQAVLVLAGADIKINQLELNDGDVRPDATAAFSGAKTFH